MCSSVVTSVCFAQEYHTTIKSNGVFTQKLDLVDIFHALKLYIATEMGLKSNLYCKCICM